MQGINDYYLFVASLFSSVECFIFIYSVKYQKSEKFVLPVLLFPESWHSWDPQDLVLYLIAFLENFNTISAYFEVQV
jgi:hypothetical protein